MHIIETERLFIRHLSADDAPFILELLNEPSFIKNIADRGVRTLDNARAYIAEGPVASYEYNGFGLSVVELKETGERIGMCGLIRRDTLEDVDIGYALFPRFWGKGYAREAAAAMLDYGHKNFGLNRIVAITSPDNDDSIRVLESIGFQFERIIPFPDDNNPVKLFAHTFQ
jgi:RimJ/RimL family protein N-acetyltransferase